MPYNIDYLPFINNDDLVLTIDEPLSLEILLMEIRGKTISYLSYKKKLTDSLENQLEKEINDRI